MPQLSIPEWTNARLVSVTPRTEHHGEDQVVALTMRFRLSGPNELLDKFSATLRKGLFRPKDDTVTLPGMEAPTPLLRAKEFEGQRFSIAVKTEGATVFVDHGIEGDVEPITMGDAKADKVTGAGYDGGSADVEKNGPGDSATPIKYQDASKPSRTWTGRGKMPMWLKQALGAGKTLADFEVTK